MKYRNTVTGAPASKAQPAPQSTSQSAPQSTSQSAQHTTQQTTANPLPTTPAPKKKRNFAGLYVILAFVAIVSIIAIIKKVVTSSNRSTEKTEQTAPTENSNTIIPTFESVQYQVGTPMYLDQSDLMCMYNYWVKDPNGEIVFLDENTMTQYVLHGNQWVNGVAPYGITYFRLIPQGNQVLGCFKNIKDKYIRVNRRNYN
ncbi:MAG: hypothetical protein RL641_734 [Candidatus Parcubacteria bacterium]|jgi:hypothetical protein